jgi:2,3-bisphosphoglycerate-independent phosphoglycerate mutase
MITDTMEILDGLAVKNDRKILLVVIDGLGGLPRGGKTELESASIPHLNKLAGKAGLGLLTPVDVGITPGSGPGHLALFGYDPLWYDVGRGVIEALGVGFHPEPTDLCARGNFATIGPDGILVDRRAGRLATDRCIELCDHLQRQMKTLGDIDVVVRPGIGHRFVVVFRGQSLGGDLTESDPQANGLKPLAIEPGSAEAEKSARVANAFVAKCAEVLAREKDANFVLLRGLGLPPQIPSMRDRFKLSPACVAGYPMYRGLAQLVGMDVLETGSTWQAELDTLRKHWRSYDFFFVHFKETDKAGEDGKFEVKQELIETFDEEILPQLQALKPDVLCITGDHATPATMGAHSWHEVPMLLDSAYVRPTDSREEFGERSCVRGTFGRINSVKLMNLLLAHSLKLRKFGA